MAFLTAGLIVPARVSYRSLNELAQSTCDYLQTPHGTRYAVVGFVAVSERLTGVAGTLSLIGNKALLERGSDDLPADRAKVASGDGYDAAVCSEPVNGLSPSSDDHSRAGETGVA
jgi:hypothetical protein